MGGNQLPVRVQGGLVKPDHEVSGIPGEGPVPAFPLVAPSPQQPPTTPGQIPPREMAAAQWPAAG